MAKILMTSIGTLGDINPAIALGKRLKTQGHQVGFASCEAYKKAALEAGLDFHLVRPSYDPRDEELCRAIMHPIKTLLNVHRMVLTSEQLRGSYEDFLDIIPEYDLVMANIFSYASKAAALKLEKKWIGLHLSPLCFFSHQDPPALFPFTMFLRLPNFLRRGFFFVLFRTMFKLADYWAKNVYELYRTEGLPAPGSTMLEAPFSSTLNLALFSPTFAQIKGWSSWPVSQIGFLDYSGEGVSALSNELEAFLSIGEPPLFFTFGSTSGLKEEEFLAPILSYLQQTKLRAVVSVSSSDQARQMNQESGNIFFCEFVPYLLAMPKMKMVIHQGGIGTTSLAMSAGIPQLILPDCTDQYDNAYRANRLGVARSIPRRKLTQKRLAQELTFILNDQSYFENARSLKLKLAVENQDQKIAEAIKLALFDNRHGQS